MTKQRDGRSGTDQWPTGRLVSAVARRIERDWNAHLALWDLNHASLPVLFMLARGPRSQRELAAASSVTEQTMSRVLARLERSGYIERRAHSADRRRYEVVLTAAGRTALAEAGDARLAEEMSVRGLEPAQVAQLRGLLMQMMTARPHPGDPVLAEVEAEHAQRARGAQGPASGPAEDGPADDE
ncbi:MarR family transcriptional regulator [Actinotalea sp. BY-33]|uniref:MarR family transcriptional regulator n=1 Tax=Actinotalea soli TaxID=2819234 RepID=A0A939LMS9_9CELL|nr:MarR family transcriptional regulator [Actinotalea soli]MBO1750621.1 MarR family transcriptional regulator [Actinotalea soli]